MKPAQLVRRVLVGLRRRFGLSHWTRLPAVPAELEGRIAPAVGFSGRDPWNDRESLLQGRFCFLRREVPLGWPPDWTADGLPLLWQYNLHYFDYLHLLAPEERLQLCEDWNRNNPMGKTVGWYPYPTSLRIVNWCKMGIRTPELLSSLYRQAAYLYRNLELYNPGNHLLENAKALLFAGYYLQAAEASAWVNKALRLLRREIPIQVLRDGGYFERSPMYHAIMLESFLDILNVMPREHADRALLLDAVTRMSDFLLSVTHPDGNIALFNDATQEIAPPTAELLDYVHQITGHQAQKKQSFAETGYFVHEGPDVYLIIDGGPIGPDYLPAHAHADIFSYELTLRGRPMVVDTGVYQYISGPMREFVRKTSAHNTVSVDGVDQVECWHSFQVGRRWAPRDVSFRKDGDETHFRGTFDGYAKLIGDAIRHQRSIVCHARKRTIEITDDLQGRGTHTAESRIHLHPDVDVTQRENGFVFQRGETTCTLDIKEGQASLSPGWYCPALGLQLRNDVVLLKSEGPLPLRIRYIIEY
jgi:uncharacterized heparinase superfamily protein